MSEGMFPQHPRSGDWETLKGRMLAPHEQPVMTSVAQDNAGSQSNPATTTWTSAVLVDTGMTGGGGTMAH